MRNFSEWIIENDIKEIDLMKIDVEGSEYDIFKSSEEVLKNIKSIHIEMNESFGECNLIKELLKKHNFYYLETSRKSNQIWVNKSYM